MVSRILRLLLGVAAFMAALLAWWLHHRLALPVPLAIGAGLGAAAAVHAGVLAAEFALAARVRGQVPAAGRLEGLARMRPWAGEVVASIRTFCYAQAFFGDKPLPSAPVPTRVPVLLVHGYFCNRALWRPLAAWLAGRGHAVGSLNLEPPFGSIGDYPALLAAELARLRAATGAASIALVGHSMGGLAIRAYLRQHGWAGVASVLTIGTPHAGTWMGQLSPATNARQMRIGSRWLAELARDEPRPPAGRMTAVFSYHDNIVVPAWGPPPEGAGTIGLAGIGHVELAYHPRVWEILASSLDTVEP